jgi:hypothetical protein
MSLGWLDGWLDTDGMPLGIEDGMSLGVDEGTSLGVIVGL